MSCAGLWETEATSVTGVLGEEITINCSHINAFSNVKYFCKGACGNEDILISSRKKTNERYSIVDKGNTFYVTISHLTEDDSGTYWCGIDRLGLDTHNKVVLKVIEGELIRRRARTAFMKLLFFITYRIETFVPFPFHPITTNISQHSPSQTDKLIFSFSQQSFHNL